MYRQRATTRPSTTALPAALPAAAVPVRAPETSADVVTAGGDDIAERGHGEHPASGTVVALAGVTTDPSGTPTDRRREAIDHHPTALGRRLDSYLEAVARELQDRGVLTGSPQRTDPADRLIGSIVLDCTALRVAAAAPTDPRRADRPSLAAALHPERPAPAVVTWDEHTGWCVGLHNNDPAQASRRHLSTEVLPPPGAVADFVVGLALGQPLGTAHPFEGRPQLRLLR